MGMYVFYYNCWIHIVQCIDILYTRRSIIHVRITKIQKACNKRASNGVGGAQGLGEWNGKEAARFSYCAGVKRPRAIRYSAWIPESPFSYQEKVRGNQKCKKNSKWRCRRCSGIGEGKWGRSCEVFLLRGGETAARHPLLGMDPRITIFLPREGEGESKVQKK